MSSSFRPNTDLPDPKFTMGWIKSLEEYQVGVYYVITMSHNVPRTMAQDIPKTSTRKKNMDPTNFFNFISLWQQKNTLKTYFIKTAHYFFHSGSSSHKFPAVAMVFHLGDLLQFLFMRSISTHFFWLTFYLASEGWILPWFPGNFMMGKDRQTGKKSPDFGSWFWNMYRFFHFYLMICTCFVLDR